jgi:predicted aspartyl protease
VSFIRCYDFAVTLRTAVATATFCLPYLLAAQPSREYVARFSMTQGIPLVQVRIDGQGPFSFVVDTGTNCEAIISPRLAKRLGLRATGRKSITDLGGHGTRTLDTVALNILSLAGADFRAVRAVVTDLPDGDSVLDGLLGFGLFRNGLLTLDYPHRRLILDEGGEEGSFAGTRDDHVVPMRMPSGIPLVEIDIAGAKAEAGIDSGALGLSIPASMIGKIRFDGGIDTVAIGRTQVSNFALRGAVLDGAVELAGFRFEQPWLELNPMFSIANIGSGALRDFVVTFDQRSRLVRFSSAGNPHRLVKPRNLANSARFDDLVGTVVTQVY